MQQDNVSLQENSWQPIPPKPKAEFTQMDRKFSITALIIGFAAVKTLINSTEGFGFMTTIVCLAVTVFNYFFAKKNSLNCSKENKFIFIITVVLSSLFVITDNDYVKVINYLIIFLSNSYFVYTSYRTNRNSIIFNLFKAVCISPLYHFGSLFDALFYKPLKSHEKKGITNNHKIMPVLIGLAASIPVCLMVLPLLTSSDKNFGKFFDNFFDVVYEVLFVNLTENSMILIMSLPVSMYIFAAAFSRVYKMKYQSNLPKKQKNTCRILPSSMCNAFLTPLILIYAAFVCLQISYLFNNYGNTEQSFNYSDYARSGFFELCFVVLINLSVCSAIMFFVKLQNKKLPISVKAFIISFALLTLCLIITAMVKMEMYIHFYGMTPLRIYTSIFMIYLFVMFIVLIIKQIKFSLSFTKIAYILAVAIIICMALLPIDRYIAQYNIDKFEQGEIGWMGLDAMEQLDASAVKAFARCNPNIAPENPTDTDESFVFYPVKFYFRSHNNIGGHNNIFNMNAYEFNFTRYFASKYVTDFNEKNPDV